MRDVAGIGGACEPGARVTDCGDRKLTRGSRSGSRIAATRPSRDRPSPRSRRVDAATCRSGRRRGPHRLAIWRVACSAGTLRRLQLRFPPRHRSARSGRRLVALACAPWLAAAPPLAPSTADRRPQQGRSRGRARRSSQAKCVACHKADGSGGVKLTGNPTPNWRDPKRWADPKRNDDYLRDCITNGKIKSGHGGVGQDRAAEAGRDREPDRLHPHVQRKK